MENSKITEIKYTYSVPSIFSLSIPSVTVPSNLSLSIPSVTLSTNEYNSLINKTSNLSKRISRLYRIIRQKNREIESFYQNNK